ncbi:aldehyde dehydrogenase family protein [Pelagerythrobacter aerophilus]
MSSSEAVIRRHKELAEKLLQSHYGHFINGEWLDSSSGETIDMVDPTTGLVLAKIQSGNGDDAVRAVEAAAAAFPAWSATGAAQRQEILAEMGRRLQARAEDFAMIDTLDNGKPFMEAMHFDIPMAVEQFQIFSGAPWQIHGLTMEAPNGLGIVHREPLGVCAQIIPWNVPLIMMASKIAPALAAGNTVVLKPAEAVCLSVMEFVKEMQDILPPGVLNVITGYGPNIGEALVTHPMVRKVAFTGSRPTAQKLIQYASVNVIPQTMELGGKSANIVCADANIDGAAEGAAMSTVLNKGEICLAGSRTFVHVDVLEEFTEKFTGLLARVPSGDPTEPGTVLGPQASQMQYDKVLGYMDVGREEGAQCLTGGTKRQVAECPEGLFIEPTVFTGVRNEMRIAQEEIFGPVNVVIPWKDEDEVLRMANDNVYGLGGGLWTRDLNRAHRMARRMETGTVWVNRYFNFIGGMPIGGYKGSGFGREFAAEVLSHYTQTKSVIISPEDGPMGVFGQ